MWTGFDYLGEPTPFNSDKTNLLNFRTDPGKKKELMEQLKKLEESQPPSRSSYFGIVDMAGFPKDRYYLYQSVWRPDYPMAHILPHWNWPDRIGKKIPVHVYTSGTEAELFVNGKSYGKKTKAPGKDYRLVWDDVVYRRCKSDSIQERQKVGRGRNQNHRKSPTDCSFFGQNENTRRKERVGFHQNIPYGRIGSCSAHRMHPVKD